MLKDKKAKKGLFMRIDDKMLHIPPHVSTHWSRISALYVKNTVLVITLVDGDTLQIPDLSKEVLEKIFTSHAAFLEEDAYLPSHSQESVKLIPPHFSIGSSNPGGDESSMRIAFGAFDEMGGTIQHNPDQANAPDLPPEVLNKVSAIAQIVSLEEIHVLPKPEPHCNCVHCQFARAIRKGMPWAENEKIEEVEEIEEVSDQDLHFQQWDIVQTGENLFRVKNRLDTLEQYYTVFLGHPVGCTCGENGCEHIVAVLKS